MKNAKKFISLITALTLVVVMVCSQPVRAHAARVGNDMYAQRASEELVIDGITYTFNYFYEEGKRVITIESSESSIVEKVSYDPATATMSYYERANELNDATGDWVLRGSGSHEITKFESKTAAGVAAGIATVLAFGGVSYVFAVLGFQALSEIAEEAEGVTIYITTYSMYVPYQGTQYLYVWSFTTSEGKSYGPYEYMEAPGIIS